MHARLGRQRPLTDPEVDDGLARVRPRVREERVGRRRYIGVALTTEWSPELPGQPNDDPLFRNVLQDDARKLTADERLRRVTVRPAKAADPPQRAGDPDVRDRDLAERCV